MAGFVSARCRKNILQDLQNLPPPLPTPSEKLPLFQWEWGRLYQLNYYRPPLMDFQTFPRPCRHESSRFSITPLLSYFIPHVPHTVLHSGVRTKCAAVALLQPSIAAAATVGLFWSSCSCHRRGFPFLRLFAWKLLLFGLFLGCRVFYIGNWYPTPLLCGQI